ncbi:uncharacterized protein LOC144906762 [Branchiostoma floridae x Branchiostoma belcheri]
MESKHRRILQKTLPEIRRDLRVIHVVPKLIERRILLKSMEHEVTNKELTHEERADELIDLLQTRGLHAFPVFCEILQETYPHLADLLQKEESSAETPSPKSTLSGGFVPAPTPTPRVYSSASSNKKEPSLFIIHAGEDKKSFVRPLHRALLGQNLCEEEIFFDEVSISTGENISDKIMSTLASEHLKLVTIVMSNHLLDKYWPRQEYEESLYHQKEFYPIWLDQNTDNFEAFSREVGRRFPRLKKRLAHRIQYDNIAEEITDVAVQIVKLLSDQCHPGTKRKRQSGQNVGRIKELSQDLEEMSSGGTDMDASWTMPELKARIELIINSQELTTEAAGRIKEIERTLFTPEILKDPRVYSQVFRTFLGHCAVILKTSVGSLLLMLSFFRVSDVDKFYHTYSRLGPGSLPAELSKVLVSKHLASINSEEQLTVRIHVEHEDYITMRNRLQKGLVRSVSLDSLLYSMKPKKMLHTSHSKCMCLDALDLAFAPGHYDKAWDSDMTKLLQHSVQERRQLIAKLEIANQQASESAAECLGLKMHVRLLLDKQESMQDQLLKSKEQMLNEKEEHLLSVQNLEKDKKSMQERTEILESQILKLKNKLALMEDTDLEEPAKPGIMPGATGGMDVPPTGDELGKVLLEAFATLRNRLVV